MCPEWAKSFMAFFSHIGPKPSPGLTLDRIDNEKGYEPGNVRWATREQQTRNRGPLRNIRHGERHPRAKLTDGKVRVARKEFKAGRSSHVIALELGVSRRAALLMLVRRTWKHVI